MLGVPNVLRLTAKNHRDSCKRYQITLPNSNIQLIEALMKSNDLNANLITKYLGESYGRYAEEYVKFLEPTLKSIASEMCRLMNRSQGKLVVDLATGTGLVARLLEQSKFTVIGVDVALGAMQSAYKLSLGKSLFIVGDAHILPIKNSCVDHVTCGLGLSHFSDVKTALREVRRILRPGGHMLASAWGNNFSIPSFSIVVELLYQYLENVDNPLKNALDEKTWGDPENGCTILEKVGFKNVQVITVPFTDTFQDPSEAFDYALAWPPISSLLNLLKPTDREKMCSEGLLSITRQNDLSQGGDIYYYQAMNPYE